MKTKYCPKCKTTLPVSEFNKSKENEDGLQDLCKECQKTDRAEKDIERLRNTRRKNKGAMSALDKARRVFLKKERSAQNAALHAINKGALIRQPCVLCGKEPALAHHENYDKKLDVLWICLSCHRKLHAARKRGERSEVEFSLIRMGLVIDWVAVEEAQHRGKQGILLPEDLELCMKACEADEARYREQHNRVFEEYGEEAP